MSSGFNQPPVWTPSASAVLSSPAQQNPGDNINKCRKHWHDHFDYSDSPTVCVSYGVACDKDAIKSKLQCKVKAETMAESSSAESS